MKFTHRPRSKRAFVNEKRGHLIFCILYTCRPSGALFFGGTCIYTDAVPLGLKTSDTKNTKIRVIRAIRVIRDSDELAINSQYVKISVHQSYNIYNPENLKILILTTDN